MLQAGMEAEGLKRISLFTRHEGNAEQNLFDMQCSWYELELAACLFRKGEWGKSLKKYGTFRKLCIRLLLTLCPLLTIRNVFSVNSRGCKAL